MITKDYDFSTFFRGVAPPTNDSRRRSVSYMEHYGSRPDLDTFYIIYDVRPPIRIKWTCNVKEVLGYSNLKYEDIPFNLHPEWQPIFLEITTAAYQVAAMRPEIFNKEEVSYHLNLPIRHAEGHFVWFRHYTVPIEFDKEGNLAAHFSLYRFIEEYSGYLKMRPQVKSKKGRLYEIENTILAIAEKSILRQYFSLLSESEQKLLADYRALIRNQETSKKRLPTAHEVAAWSNRPLTTVKTYSHRILGKVKPHFPLQNYETIAELAYLLEWIFGPEKR